MMHPFRVRILNMLNSPDKNCTHFLLCSAPFPATYRDPQPPAAEPDLRVLRLLVAGRESPHTHILPSLEQEHSFIRRGIDATDWSYLGSAAEKGLLIPKQ